jgi:MoxR-like ATPase
VFKSNSAILNALLTLLNERKYTSGGQVIRCPLISVFAASNEVPGDETLNAIFDRFLLRVRSDNLDAYHFSELLQRGIAHEIRQMSGQVPEPLLSARELVDMGRSFGQRMNFSDAFLSAYKGLVFQIRAEGISLSDRRVVKMLKLFAASAFIEGRPAADPSATSSSSSTCGTTKTKPTSSRASFSRCSRPSTASTLTAAGSARSGWGSTR